MAKPVADGPFNLLRPEDSAGADYPTVREDSEGRAVLVINSDQQYRYVGNLLIEWDNRGHIVDVDARSGPVATTYEAIQALQGVTGEPANAPIAVRNSFASLLATPLIQDAFTVVGETDFPLNGLRANVRTRETNLGRVAADSTLWVAERDFPAIATDIALKNGGGIRDTITGPAIIRLTIQAALAFDNRLSVLELSGEQLIAAMENAVSRVPAADGRFPQIAGMAIEYDPSRPGVQNLPALATPSRIRSLVVTRSSGQSDVLVDNFQAQGDLSRTFVMATNSFLTTGGDGYASLAAAKQLAITTTGEQQILEEYIQQALGGVVTEIDPPSRPRVRTVAAP